MSYLLEEIQRLSQGASIVKSLFPDEKVERRMIMSVGATPSSSSVVNLLGPPTKHNQSPIAVKLRETVNDVLSKGLSIELHAGNYPFLDLQQVYTQAKPSVFTDSGSPPLLNTKDIAFSILAEVASVYPDRTPPQALIAAGCLALGREPCPGYSGWGMLSDWGISPLKNGQRGNGKAYSGWEVVKVSQEHGILQASAGSRVQGVTEMARSVDRFPTMPFAVGQQVRIWPNHSCVAAASFGFYAVVDSSMENPDTVVDVWVRCRGW